MAACASARRPLGPRRGERGLGVVLVAVLAVLLMGVVGLAVDAGHVQTAAQQLQDAADAAALAAAQVLADEAPSGGSGGAYPATRQAAIDVAALNSTANAGVQLDANAGNAESGDIVVGTWDRDTGTFTATTSAPDAVRVVARRTTGSGSGPLSLIFGGLFGAADGQVARSAIATTVATPNPSIHVLDPSAEGALTLSGNAFLDVGSGKVQVNSSDCCALKFNGTPHMVAGSTEVHGGACYPGGSISGPVVTWGDAVPDALSGILPTTAAWTTLKNGLPKPLGANGKISSTGSYNPGYYPKGLSITSSTKVTLKPGTYLFGAGFSLAGQSSVTGAGVTILLDSGVKLSVLGGGKLDLAPTVAGQFEGLTLMFHRNSTSSTTCSIGGTGSLSFLGTLYCPSGGVTLAGTANAQAFGQVVCDTLKVSGTPDVTGVAVVPPANGGRMMLVD